MLDKQDLKNVAKIILSGLLAGLIIGMFVSISEQTETIEQLETELVETREQLNVANDQLKQINMRNEAIYYINQLEQGMNEVDE